MYKKTTKALAIILSLVMLLGLMPLTALAEEEEYELRTLTFEDADWKGDTNYVGGKSWSSLIDSSQYDGALLYPQGDSAVAYNWYDENNTELFHELPDGWGDHQYWGGGHAVSHYAASDTTQYGDYMSQLTVFKAGVEGMATSGGGHNGSDNFAVHFGYNDGTDYSMSVLPALSFVDGEARVIDHMYVTSTCYNLYCNVSGNSLTPSLGENDYVKLVATGTHEDGTEATSEFTLASGSSVVTDWTKWDLSGLGAVTEVTFNVIGSSDNGFGFSQPAYFAYDDVAVRFPMEVNQAPQLIDGVEPTAFVTRRVNTAYQLTDLREGRIFEDPEGETLDYSNYFYQRSADGGETWGVVNHFDGDTLGYSDMILIETTPGMYTYRFFAVDSEGASSADNDEYWTLTLNVVEEGVWPITFYVSYEKYNWTELPIIKLYPSKGVDPETNYPIYDESEEIAFTDSTFGVDPENGEPSGTVENNRKKFYASLSDGWYVYRGWAWNEETEAYDIDLGGMQIFIPTDENADGAAGGGTEIYLKPQYITARFNRTYLTADEFDTEVRCPIMQCNAFPGAVWYYNSHEYDTYLLYAGGNSCLYNYVVNPVDTTVYASNMQINQTVVTTGNGFNTSEISVYSAGTVSVEVPAFADFNLYQQLNNFNTITIQPDSVAENGDTKTLTFTVGVPSSSSTKLNYSWRLSDPNRVYRTKTDFTVPVGSWSVDFDSTDRKTHDKGGLGDTIRDSDDADIMVNLDPKGYASFTETRRVRAYRFWEIVNSITANIMMEPDFNWQVLVGNEDDIVTLSGGNTGDNWADVTPTTTDIVAVSYDSIDAGTGSLVGVFPATTPHRTAVFVATNEPQGSADANIRYNTDGTEQTRGDGWDYFYDTWYYLDTDEAPTLDFTLTGEAQVDYAFVTTNDDLVSTLSDWTSLTAGENGYSVPLIGFRQAGIKGGTVIIRMTAADGVSYRLARVSEMRVEIENSTNPGESIMPGNEITATIYGTFRGIYKIAGIFNPQAFRVEYFFNGELVSANVSSQYGVANGLKLTMTVPEEIDFGEGDTTELVLTGGHAFTQMFSAPNPFDLLYSMTDNGVGTNFNASTVKVSFQRMADVAFTVSKTVAYDMRVDVVDEDGPVEGCNITLTDPEGNTLTPGEDGLYHGLVYGEYPYSIGKAGYLANNGAITLGSADAAELTDGVVVRTITLEKAAEGGWDGVTYTEPAADENGVYQIATGAELAWFMDHVNSGGGDASAVLIADIDLANYPWTPIGGENVFSGSFDGQGHTVSHLFIDRRLEANAAPHLGLFGVVEGTEDAPAVVKDLTVEGSIAIASEISIAEVESGGVIGRAKFAEITGAVNRVDVSISWTKGAWRYTGGVVGRLLDGTAADCRNEAAISGRQLVGGIAGNITRSTVTRCINTGAVSGYQYTGGVLGYTEDGDCSCVSCVNTGAVTGAGSNTGGVIGSLSGGSAESIRNVGVVEGRTYMGGLLGTMSMNTTLKDSYNAGTVISSGGTASGAIVGSNGVASSITNTYYLEGVYEVGIGSPNNNAATVAEFESVTAEELRALAYDLGSGFKSVCGGYPVLTWEEGTAHTPGEVVFAWNGTASATASAVCSECGVTETVDAVITAETQADGTCVFTATAVLDGQTYTDTVTEAPAAQVVSASLTLAGDIGVNFYIVPNGALSTAQGAAYQFTVKGIPGEKLPLSDAPTSELDGVTRSVLTYYVAAKEMTEQITLRVFLADGSEVTLISPSGAVLDGAVYSVARFVRTAAEVGSEKLQALSAKLASYGAYAKAYFEYEPVAEDTEYKDYIAGDITGDITVETVTPYKPVKDASTDAFKAKSISLVLKSETILKVTFAGTDVAQYTFTVDGEPVSAVKSGANYVVQIPDIAAQDLDKAYTIVATNGDQTYTISAYALTYAYQVLKAEDRTDAIRDLVKALYEYNQAANAYFA